MPRAMFAAFPSVYCRKRRFLLTILNATFANKKTSQRESRREVIVNSLQDLREAPEHLRSARKRPLDIPKGGACSAGLKKAERLILISAHIAMGPCPMQLVVVMAVRARAAWQHQSATAPGPSIRGQRP